MAWAATGPKTLRSADQKPLSSTVIQMIIVNISLVRKILVLEFTSYVLWADVSVANYTVMQKQIISNVV